MDKATNKSDKSNQCSHGLQSRMSEPLLRRHQNVNHHQERGHHQDKRWYARAEMNQAKIGQSEGNHQQHLYTFQVPMIYPCIYGRDCKEENRSKASSIQYYAALFPK